MRGKACPYVRKPFERRKRSMRACASTTSKAKHIDIHMTANELTIQQKNTSGKEKITGHQLYKKN